MIIKNKKVKEKYYQQAKREYLYITWSTWILIMDECFISIWFFKLIWIIFWTQNNILLTTTNEEFFKKIAHVKSFLRPAELLHGFTQKAAVYLEINSTEFTIIEDKKNRNKCSVV